MRIPILTYSDNELPVIQQFTDGSWVYNFNRQSHEEECEHMNDNLDSEMMKTVYTAITVTSDVKPTYKEAVEKVIRLYLSSSEEFDLINSAYQGDDTEYKEWLVKLKEIKTKIRKDFEDYEQTH